mgnify:CR=1 FL=1
MARKKDDALHVKRKSQILAAARACFIEHGIHQTSMQQICSRGEISPGALYRYFPSKQSIIEAIAASEHQSNTDLIDFLAEAKDPVAALQEAVPDLLDHILDPDFARLMVEISAEASRNTSISKTFDEVEAQFQTELEKIFNRAAKPFSLKRDQHIKAQIFIFLALLDGLVARAAHNDLPPRKQLVMSVQKTIRGLFA